MNKMILGQLFRRLLFTPNMQYEEVRESKASLSNIIYGLLQIRLKIN